MTSPSFFEAEEYTRALGAIRAEFMYRPIDQHLLAEVNARLVTLGLDTILTARLEGGQVPQIVLVRRDDTFDPPTVAPRLPEPPADLDQRSDEEQTAYWESVVEASIRSAIVRKAEIAAHHERQERELARLEELRLKVAKRQNSALDNLTRNLLSHGYQPGAGGRFTRDAGDFFTG